MERRDSLRQIAQQVRKLSLHATFIHMVIPAAAIEKGDFETKIRFEQFGNFHEAFPEAAIWIVRAVFRRIGIGIDFLELVDGFKRFLADAAHGLVHRLRVHGLKAAFDSLLRTVHLELL